MKKIIQLLCVLLLSSLLLTSCQNTYVEKDGAIYYKWSNGATMKSEYTLIKEADVATFMIIKNKMKIPLGKDKNNVYKDNQVLKLADPVTFEHISQRYWKDKAHVYFLNVYGNDHLIQDADPSTFKVIKEFWAKDQNNIYYVDKKLNTTNLGTFEVIDENWARNSTAYFYHDLEVQGLDYETAHILSRYYIKDKKKVFFETLVVEDANPETFKADSFSGFGEDDRFKFYNEKKQ